MKLIVGLGNPGEKYSRTRHNAGAMALERFRLRHPESFGEWHEKFRSLVSEGRIGDEKVALLLPQTYMNESGRAVREAVDFWKVETEQLLVVSDDFSLPFGTVRLRRDGSAGGHNGLKSVFEMMSTESIPRLRIGIGNVQMYRTPAEKFVLERFSAEEEGRMDKTMDRISDALDKFLDEGLDAAMNAFN
ncbi:MAG: aminoacyl-tRNA hydrolase [bacterium]